MNAKDIHKSLSTILKQDDINKMKNPVIVVSCTVFNELKGENKIEGVLILYSEFLLDDDVLIYDDLNLLIN